MILYHFTAAALVTRIKERGLTKGAIPWRISADGLPTMRRGFQWLTADANWHQPWCLEGNLPYARNAYRITVSVPGTHFDQLYRWRDVAKKVDPSAVEYLAATGDVAQWFVFHGPIPPSWFIETARNPFETLTPASRGEIIPG